MDDVKSNPKATSESDSVEPMETDTEVSNSALCEQKQEAHCIHDVNLDLESSDLNISGDANNKENADTEKTDEIIEEASKNSQQQNTCDENGSNQADFVSKTEDQSEQLSPNADTPVVERPASSMNTESCDEATPPASGSDVTGAVGGSGIAPSAPHQSVYHVKWIKFKGDQVAIITQNENGPCPLLAIMNSLLLQAKVKLPVMMEIITSGQLMEYLGDCIFENAPKNLAEESRLNYEQNMSDAMAVFDRLQTGLDVNVRFTGVREFEYTRECIVFDLLNIQLYHGWLADPQNSAEIGAVGQCSYNQLVEKIIEQKSSSEASQVTEALVAEEFLNRSCHQLTYHGLSELSSTTKEGELCVFFRNNHFSTLLRHKNELFTLVTDQGYLTEPNVVWETLSNVEGDGHYVDSEFRTYRKPEVPAAATTPPNTNPDVAAGSPQQIDQDYLVALSLQDDIGPSAGSRARDTTTSPDTTTPEVNPATAGDLTDQELARKLQEEEDRQMSVLLQQREQQAQQQPASHTRQQPHQQQQQGSSSRERDSRERGGTSKKSSDCIIL